MPDSPPAPDLVPAPAPAGAGPPRGRVTVAVADDNDTFRAGIVRALRRCDDLDLVAEAPDGAAALRMAREHRPTVLVVDDRMPGMTGVEVARAVATDPSMGAVRVLLLTARTDPGMTVEARDAGAVGCVDKAVSRREICTAIRSAAGLEAPHPATA